MGFVNNDRKHPLPPAPLWHFVGNLGLSLSDVNAKPPQEFLQYQLCSAYCLMWKEETPQKGNP